MSNIVLYIITIVGSLFIFIVSQYFLEIVLKPFLTYKKLKSDISYLLEYYANIYSAPLNLANASEQEKGRYFKASEEFRILAAKLFGFIQEMPRIRFYIPSREKLCEAAHELIGLSNSFAYIRNSTIDTYDKEESNLKRRDNIRKILSFYVVED